MAKQAEQITSYLDADGLAQNGDVNTARRMQTVLDDPAWKDDMGRLANGFINRQQNGAWHTTTANLWGGFALEKFSAKFEAAPVTGTTKARRRRAMAAPHSKRAASSPSAATTSTCPKGE